MAKDLQFKNKKYAKLSPDEAEAKQRIANRRERQRQSNLSDAIKFLNNLISTNNDGRKQPSQFSIILDTIDYIKDIQKELQDTRILVSQLQGQLEISSRPRQLTGRQPAVLDTPQSNNDSLTSQLQDQLNGNSQYLPSNTSPSHFSTGGNSCRLPPPVLDTPPTSNDSLASQLQNQLHGNSQYDPSDSIPTHFSTGGHSCRFQPYSIGPAMTDYMYVGNQAPHAQTSATHFPAASTTNQFQSAPTDYTSCLYRKF